MLKPKTRWVIRPENQQKIDLLVNELQLAPLVASLLVNRGLDTVESARYFLFGNEPFHDPFLFKDMEKAVARIKEAIQLKEPILIFGDYDADGVSSTTVLMRTFRDLGANVQFYIPNRFTEGYGPNEQAFRRAAEMGMKVIITVDTGIAAVHEASVAKELGMDLIITDHHEFGPSLPEAFAIIHPKLPDNPYPFSDLAGVGVAFKLSHALYGKIPEHLLEIAVIGTIADLVSLTGENRLIVKKGLEKLKTTENIGLKAIFKQAGVNPTAINEETIGFSLAPRINAVGRLESADLAVELLLTEDLDEAKALAEEMEHFNKMRQTMVNSMTEEAIEIVETNFPPGQNHVLVIGKEGWNPGVIGIVASRLVEKYYRPAIIFSYDQKTGLAKGSARSIAGFDLFQNLSACRDILPHFGGHPMAAGMTLHMEDVAQLRTRLNQLAGEQLTEEDFIPVTWLDSDISLPDADLETIDKINLLAPFGVDNPKPRIVIENVQISQIRKIGSDQTHLKLCVTDKEKAFSLDGVGFGLGKLADHISPVAEISLIGVLSVNEWNNIRKPQIFIEDISIEKWQLFDFRGGNRMDQLLEMVPKQKGKWIVFNEDTVQRLSSFSAEEITLIDSPETARAFDITDSYIVLFDLPRSRQILCELIKGKNPSRLYACFMKDESDFFSTLPSREHFKWFYAFLLQKDSINLTQYGEAIAKKRGWSKETIFFMSKVFYELDFVTINNGLITIKRQALKRDLTDSATFRLKQEQFALENELLFSSYQQLKDWFDQLLCESAENEEVKN